jgi:hypothetical protein
MADKIEPQKAADSDEPQHEMKREESGEVNEPKEMVGSPGAPGKQVGETPNPPRDSASKLTDS